MSDTRSRDVGLARSPRRDRGRCLLLGIALFVGCAILGSCRLAMPSEPRTRLDLVPIRTAALELRAMLEDYYDGSRVLERTWLRGADDLHAEARVAALRDKFAQSLVWGDPFVVGMIGSSVLSGAANCRADAYPDQLLGLFGPILSAGGGRMEVRNAGQDGHCGDAYQNQIFCLETFLGDDLDVVHYSWTYFEAGRDDPPSFHETFYRWSAALASRPVPQLVYTSDCARLADMDHRLLDAYAPLGVNALCMQRGLLEAGYPGKKWGAVGDSLHDTTRAGEVLPLDSGRRRSLGVVFRDWHPGPLLFQTTSDAIVYAFSEALLLAIDAVADAPDPRRRWPLASDATMGPRLPEPIACDPGLCDLDETPRCWTGERPRFGNAGIRLRPSSQRDPGSPAPGWSSWESDPEDDVPPLERGRPECARRAACAGLRPIDAGQTGWLEFEGPPLERGFVAVCCAGKRCGERILERRVEFRIDGRAIEETPQVLWDGKCVQVADEWPGAARMAIRVPAPSPDDVESGRDDARRRTLPAITHVFGF